MINYVTGDATKPQGSGPKLILHICNDVGAWGAGFVLALSKRWPEPEDSYRAWFQSKKKFSVGNIQNVLVEPDLFVINMLSQRGLRCEGYTPMDYEALDCCLYKVAQLRSGPLVPSIHMPRIGCGLAGGEWNLVEPIIENRLNKHNVTVYDFE